MPKSLCLCSPFRKTSIGPASRFSLYGASTDTQILGEFTLCYSLPVLLVTAYDNFFNEIRCQGNFLFFSDMYTNSHSDWVKPESNYLLLDPR